MIGRREALGAFALSAGAALAPQSAAACSLVTTKTQPFRLGVCEKKIRDFVAFANIAYLKSDEEIKQWKNNTGITPSYNGDALDNENLLKSMRISEEKIDPRPIRISELKLLKRVRNRSVFQFTLVRHRFFPADEGCNGLDAYDDKFDDDHTPYVAEFYGLDFVAFRELPEWPV